MKKMRCRLVANGFCAAALLTVGAGAGAQTLSPPGDGRSGQPSFLRDNYVGLNLGRADYDLDCGASGNCDDPDAAGRIYFGSMFSRNFGVEVGYLHMGEAERGGGDTRAQGLNLSMVGRLPLGGDAFGVFGKLGTTYGRTKTSAAAGSGITTGDASGWGASYGAGLSYDFAGNWSTLVEWERHRFKFAGDHRDWVDSTSVGLKYRF